jgi:hypothetical protein
LDELKNIFCDKLVGIGGQKSATILGRKGSIFFGVANAGRFGLNLF